MKKILLFLAVVAMVLPGCTESGTTDSPQSIIEIIDGAEELSLNFPSYGDLTKSVTFKSNYDWSATASEEWIKVSPESGAAGEECQVQISLDENTTDEARSGKIIISIEAFATELSIVQQQKNVLILSDSDIYMDKEGGVFEVELQHNTNYTIAIEEECDWIFQVENRAATTSTLKFNVTENTSGQERTATITIRGESLTETITVNQNHKEFGAYPQSNEIWYTSTDGNIIEPGPKRFDANIVSNTYDSGKGIILFDAPITSIGYMGFYNHDRLTSITIPESVTSIGKYAFGLCTSLTSITIPDSVTLIGEYAFDKCLSLTSVTIGNSVTSIGERAFNSCSGLTSVTIGNSVTSIGREAFRGCSSLTSITIPDSVTSIGEYAFDSCTNLARIRLSDSLTKIGIGAFKDCTSLTSIQLPYGLMEIGGNAFANCTSLTDCKIPLTVTMITSNPFSGCEALKKTIDGLVYYADDICVGVADDDRYRTSYSIQQGTRFLAGGYFTDTIMTSITIPNSVLVIGDSFFSGCTSLTSITIPDSVTYIGFYAFQYCSALTSITIPNSVTKMGRNPFLYCSSLRSFHGKFAFRDSRCLIIDGELVSFAPEGATTYTIPDGVTSIGWYAFSHCSSLTSVDIPNGVTSIGLGAFEVCTSLANINIPEGVTLIDTSAFKHCGLTSVTIPASVTEIGEYGFRDNERLVSVYCKAATPPSGGTNMFKNNGAYRKIYVPTESVSAYKSANGWSDYASYIEGDDF